MSAGVTISFSAATTVGGGLAPQVVSNANPLPVALSGGIGGLAVAGTVADATAVLAQFPVTVGGVDYATGLAHRLNTDLNGNLNVNLAGGGSLTVVQPTASLLNAQVVGNVASATADSGNPVKIGGIVNTTLPTFSVGQRGDAQLTTRGLLSVGVFVAGAAITASVANADALVQTGSQTYLNTASLGLVNNGATLDRVAKPRTAFRLPSSLATNNAANIKTTPGTVYSVSGNVTLASSICYLKFFDVTGSPNPAAINPLYFFPLSIVDAVFSFNLPGNGLYFPTGIGVAIVANPADLDNTAIAAGQITALNVSFL